MDYGTLKIYPGNYDEYMLASTQARNQQLSNNAKAKEKVAELQEFVRRFSANKSKARQATSRAKMIDKIKVEDMKPSSRAYPFVRFEGEKKLHRLAVETEGLSKKYDRQLFKNFSIMVEAGERIAIIGANGAGKTTLLRSIGGHDITGLDADSGRVKWAENANVGYMPQDPTEEFATEITLTDWMGKWTKEGDDDQAVRSILGRLLFGGDEVKKSVRVLSGGEKGRMMYGKLMLGRHNVLLLDEPTNHMDMESIESLNIALEKYAGTLIFVSHDREFVSSLANRIIEIKENEIIDYSGNYEDYLTSQGIN
jgi:ATPase subunit of ABC transporter with duplicated ATPase domains